MGTFSNIEIGKNGIMTHQSAIGVVGHNISNMNTEGYSRQKIRIATVDPLARAELNRPGRPGQVGQGPKVESIKRVRDELLDTRIVESTHEESFWKTRESYLLKLDHIYNEPTETSLRSMMDNFWQSFQELSVFPEQGSARQVVLERAHTLAEGVAKRFNSLELVRKEASEDIALTVKRVNDITTEVAKLNKEIKRSVAVGDNPNDLMDKRDLLVNELSNYMSITVLQKDGKYNVHTQGFHLIEDGSNRTLELGDAKQFNEGHPDVYWADTKEKFEVKGGKLESLFIMRDVDIKNEVQSLDTMAANVVSLTNSIHREGYNLAGETGKNFFVEYPFINNAQGNYDSNGDGAEDSSRISTLVGVNKLKGEDQIGVEGVLTLSGPQGNINVNYYQNDTVKDLLIRINTSGSEVTANLDQNGRLILKGTPSKDYPDFVIRHVADNGDLLQGYAGLFQNRGEAFDYTNVNAVNVLRQDANYSVAPENHPAAYMQVEKKIEQDAANIAAASTPETIGNGEIALKLAGIRNTEVMVGKIRTFDDYFANSIANIGSLGQEAKLVREEKETSMKYLKDLRDSVSGVNLDEELSELLKFQHGYNASARFVTVADSLLDTIINKMGV